MFYPLHHVIKQKAGSQCIESMPGFSISLYGHKLDLYQCYKDNVTVNGRSYKTYMFKHEAGFALLSWTRYSATLDVYNTNTFSKVTYMVSDKLADLGISVERKGLSVKTPESYSLVEGATAYKAGDRLYKNGVDWGSILLVRDDALVVEDSTRATRVINRNDECMLKALGIAFLDEEKD